MKAYLHQDSHSQDAQAVNVALPDSCTARRLVQQLTDLQKGDQHAGRLDSRQGVKRDRRHVTGQEDLDPTYLSCTRGVSGKRQEVHR